MQQPPEYPSYYGPPPQKIQPPRKPVHWLWYVVLGIMAVIALGVVVHLPNNESGANVTANTATTSAPLWLPTHTFKGNGNKKTETFTVGSDWRIVWSCSPASDASYNVIVNVYNADGSAADLAAINTICQAGNTGDITEEHQGGTIYLEIVSEGGWTVTVQEPE